MEKLPQESKVFKVKKICSQCGKDMGEIESPIDKPSHGTCEECFRLQMKEMKNILEGEKQKKKNDRENI